MPDDLKRARALHDAAMKAADAEERAQTERDRLIVKMVDDGLSQAAVAKALGVTPQRVSQIVAAGRED